MVQRCHPPDSTTPPPRNRGGHTDIHTYIQTYIHTYTIHRQTYKHFIHIPTNTHTHITYMNACIHTYIYTYLPPSIHYIPFHSIPLHTIPNHTIYTYHTSSTSQTPHHHRPQGGTTRSKTEHPSPLWGWPTRNHIYMYMYTFP